MSINIRCKKCGARRSIPDKTALIHCKRTIKYYSYEGEHKCKSCGNRTWRIDWYRMKKERGIKPSCDCGGYHFRHRKGSLYCYHHPDAERIQSARWSV